MARGNKYTCATCGKEYEFCPKCAVTKPAYDAERYCSKKHADIFEILSKHGCGLATAGDTLKALVPYNTDAETLTPSIRKHISTIKAESKPAVEIVRPNVQPVNNV